MSQVLTIGRQLAGRQANARRRRRLLADASYAASGERRFDVLLNFPDAPVNLYQVRQWYGPLEELAKHRSVAILCYRPDSAEIIHGETSLPIVLTGGPRNLSAVQRINRPKVILYPNQNYSNFRILGLNSCQHVFISHGESDKIYMSSNWVKVFNYYFVAGEAARTRLRQRLFRYDVDRRTVAIGRPQIDVEYPAPAGLPTGDRRTVLYAPTWEGGRPSMRYGSVLSHAEDFVQALIADPRYRVIYRPHPRTGVQLPEHGLANERVKAMLAAANEADPAAHHFFDDTPFGWQLKIADAMITDVSAVAYDWLTTAKPLLMTMPEDPSTVVERSNFVGDARLVEAREASGIVGLLDEVFADEEQAETMRRWSRHYYGDTSPGASMRRFLEAIDRLIAERDSWIAAAGDRADLPAPLESVGALANGERDDAEPGIRERLRRRLQLGRRGR